MFSRFGTILACDGQTDGRRDDDSIYLFSIALHGKKLPDCLFLYTKCFQKKITFICMYYRV